jgi:choice-of-anchor B domain-containing protein
MAIQLSEPNTRGASSIRSLRSRLKATLFAFSAALALLLVVGSGVNAHDDSMPGQGQVPPHARDTMRAFAAEHHHNENLAAQSITACVGGFAGTYPCSNVDLMAFLPLAQIGGGNGNDIWGWTDPANGNEYAIMGLTNGTAFVDVTDPVNPLYLGHLPPPAGVLNSSWRDIKVYANHAFIGSEALGSGLQIMDLAQLGNVPAPPVTFVQTAHYTGFSTSHNVVINEDSGYAYGVGTNNGNCGHGLHFVIIANPASPQAAGCFDNDGYTHDAQCVNYSGPDIEHLGKEICFAYNEDTLTIVDVSDKASPLQISRTPYPQSNYTHQG